LICTFSLIRFNMCIVISTQYRLKFPIHVCISPISNFKRGVRSLCENIKIKNSNINYPMGHMGELAFGPINIKFGLKILNLLLWQNMYDVYKQPYFSLGVFTMVVMLVLVHPRQKGNYLKISLFIIFLHIWS